MKRPDINMPMEYGLLKNKVMGDSYPPKWFEDLDEVKQWCKDNCKGMYWIGFDAAHFEFQEDAAYFTLRWA